MKRSIFILAFLSLASLLAFAPPTQEISRDTPALFQQDSTDILNAVLALQKSMPAPPTEFRAGHVTPKKIEDYLEPNAKGFVIQLPKGSLTPSPTIYENLLLISGGFGSKEFYAFDAATGAVRWALDLDDDGPSSAVVEDDIVVFNTESCTIFACNVYTGALLWSHYLGDPLMSTPSIADGIVYTAYPAKAPSYGNFYNSMNIQQQVPSPNYDFLSPTPDSTSEGSMTASHVLIALELRTGRIVWQKWIDGDVMSAPVIEGKEVYITTFPGTLYKFDAQNGEILAAQASRATSAPVIAGEEIYMSRRADQGTGPVEESLSTLNRQLSLLKGAHAKAAPYLDQQVQSRSTLKASAIAYDAGNGFTAGAPVNSGWQAASYNIGQSNVSSLQAFQGSRILHYQRRNYATMGDELLCTNPKSGKVYWRKKLKGNLQREGGFLATPPLSVDGKIIYATLNGEIFLRDAVSGKELHRYSTGEQIRFQPVVAGGRIYVTTTSGKVFCFETGNDRLTGWQTWGANAAHTNRIEQHP